MQKHKVHKGWLGGTGRQEKPCSARAGNATSCQPATAMPALPCHAMHAQSTPPPEPSSLSLPCLFFFPRGGSVFAECKRQQAKEKRDRVGCLSLRCRVDGLSF